MAVASQNLFNDGKGYERLMGRWSKLAGVQFLDWINPPKNLRWLDVGCGNGAFTETLIEKAAPAAVTGIDPSDGQLDYARTRPGAKLAEFRIAGAQALPFPDDSFDAAAMALVIVFVPDPLQAAREMARVVKPGGIVATYMWDFPGGGFPLGRMIQAVKALGVTATASSNPEASRMEAMRGVWEEAGLQEIDTRVIRVPISFTDFDDYWDSNTVPMGTYGSAIAAMSADERERLKNHMRQILPIAADGTITYESFANAVKGRAP
jgi:ubiquinone/menaquinone biosynthesis C-methylase UbiE